MSDSSGKGKGSLQIDSVLRSIRLVDADIEEFYNAFIHLKKSESIGDGKGGMRAEDDIYLATSRVPLDERLKDFEAYLMRMWNEDKDKFLRVTKQLQEEVLRTISRRKGKP